MNRLFWSFILFSAVESSLAEDNTEIWPISDFAVIGEGPQNVLIIPCMSCRWRAFEEFMARNAARYTNYAVTVPGFGGSEVPGLPMWTDQPLWHQNAVAAVLRFVDEQEIDDAILISHSWGSVLAAEVLAERSDFARAWVILDTFVPFDPEEQNLPYPAKLQLVENWRRASMEPLRTPDEWASFNAPAPYLPADRQLLYFGMFMATPPDVVFQYWRENGLRPINDWFAEIALPVLEVKSIPPGEVDVEAAKSRYRARYETVQQPCNFQTIFIEKTGHHQVEQRPEIIDEIVSKFLNGEPLTDYTPD